MPGGSLQIAKFIVKCSQKPRHEENNSSLRGIDTHSGKATMSKCICLSSEKGANSFLLWQIPFNPSLAKHDMPVLANSVDPDQLSSEGSAMFVIK